MSKIVVLTGSPRKKGNSNSLADSFCNEARLAGHKITRFEDGQGSVVGDQGVGKVDGRLSDLRGIWRVGAGAARPRRDDGWCL